MSIYVLYVFLFSLVHLHFEGSIARHIERSLNEESDELDSLGYIWLLPFDREFIFTLRER